MSVRVGPGVLAGNDAAVAHPAARALSERILDRLGAPRWAWILGWGSVPIISAGASVALRRAGVGPPPPSIEEVVLHAAISAYAVVLLLWGVGRLTAGIRTLEPQRTVGGAAPVVIDHRAIASRIAPLALAVALTGVATAETMADSGLGMAAAILPLEFLNHVPIASFLWVYLVFLVELHRLGSQRLALDVFPEDRGLGLTGLGSVAFTGFTILVAYLVPSTIVNASDAVAVMQLAAGTAVTLAAFVLSMWRLHDQMRRAKAGYVAAARRLYAEAYAPLQVNQTLSVLLGQAAALGSAQALEQRAQAIHEWPIDEPTTARLAIVMTGIVTGLVVRIVGTGLHV